jgi:hypothetical protein
MTRVFITSAFIVCLFSAGQCYAQRNIAGNYSFQSECVGVEMDGSQTLKAWGFGRNRGDALEQAKKNAVRDVLFRGIRNGKTECNVKPVVFDMNAQEKYEDYFNSFFADGGEYKKFINQKDEPFLQKLKKDKKKGDNGVEIGVVVRVLRAQIKQKMISDNIITQ